MAQIKFTVKVGSSVAEVKKLDASFMKLFERLSLIKKKSDEVKKGFTNMCDPRPIKEFTTKTGKLVAALKRSKSEADRLRQALRKTGQEGATAGAKLNKSFGAGLTKSLMKAGLGLMGVSQGVQLVRSGVMYEIQRRKQAHDMMGQRLSGMERPTTKLTINLAALGMEGGRAFEGQLEEQRKRLGMPVNQYRTAASAVFSGVGADPARTLDTMGTVGRIARAFAPEQLATLAGAVADIQGQMRLAMPGNRLPTSREAMGVMVAGMGQSRAASVQDFAPNFAKLLGSVLQGGGTIQTAIALSAGATQGAADPQTRISTTAAINLATSTLRDFLVEEQGLTEYKDRKKHSIDDLLKLTMKDKPELGKKFAEHLFDNNELEAKARSAIAAMFSDTASQSRVAFDNALANVPDTIAKFGEMSDALLARINEQPTTVQGDLNRSMESFLDSQAIGGGVRVTEEMASRFKSISSLAENRKGFGLSALAADWEEFATAGITIRPDELSKLADKSLSKVQDSHGKRRAMVLRDSLMPFVTAGLSESARGRKYQELSRLSWWGNKDQTLESMHQEHLSDPEYREAVTKKLNAPGMTKSRELVEGFVALAEQIGQIPTREKEIISRRGGDRASRAEELWAERQQVEQQIANFGPQASGLLPGDTAKFQELLASQYELNQTLLTIYGSPPSGDGSAAPYGPSLPE